MYARAHGFAFDVAMLRQKRIIKKGRGGVTASLLHYALMVQEIGTAYCIHVCIPFGWATFAEKNFRAEHVRF